MALPPTVRVKLSSEAAESISLTPVVVQEMPVRELVEHMLGVTGKDEARIREMLLRGTLVSGASRFRWAGWDGGRRRICASCWRRFPIPTRRARSPPRVACARSCAAGGRRSRSRARPATRKGLFQRETFLGCADGGDRRRRPVAMPATRIATAPTGILREFTHAETRSSCAPPAALVKLQHAAATRSARVGVHARRSST